MRASTAKMERLRKIQLCAIAAPRSRAVGAAFEETRVAVTAGRFYWVTRSREGVGSMGRDSPVERNGPSLPLRGGGRPQA